MKAPPPVVVVSKGDGSTGCRLVPHDGQLRLPSLLFKRRIPMTKLMLIAGTAIVLTAAPATAGGPGGGGLLGGVTGTGGSTLGKAQGASGKTGTATSGLGDCLCQTVKSALAKAGSIGRGGHG